MQIKEEELSKLAAMYRDAEKNSKHGPGYAAKLKDVIRSTAEHAIVTKTRSLGEAKERFADWCQIACTH